MDYADGVAVLIGLTAAITAINAAKLLPAATATAGKWIKATFFG
jgi:hypothetical protein